MLFLNPAGGNGDEGELIIKHTKERHPDLKIKYYLLDANKEDIEMAKERFEELHSEQVQTVALARDLSTYEFDADKMSRDIGLPQEGVDIVINSGGLLNQSVTLDAEDAKGYYQMYLQSLKKEGSTMFISGITPSHISSQNHRENGMKILNLYDEFNDLQMHVVKCLYKEEE